MAKGVIRLVEKFIPKHYVLDITLDKKAMKFSGSVIISGQNIYKPSHRLVFHQVGLRITRAHVIKHDRKGDTELTVDRLNTHAAYEEVRIHTKELVYPGQYTIRLEFSGRITRPMDGLYPCFFEHNGQQKVLLATQFESHHARQVFPCIDEPAAKANFDLTLHTTAGETVLSNMPVREQSEKDGLLTSVFETTPHMSTYLLAFVAGELGYKEGRTKDGIVIRAYATPDNVAFLDFAVDTTVKVLEFYNDYFGIDYPLPKCDLVALPDFAAGAMENWGLITFREHSLLLDPENTSIQGQQWIAMVIAHELAHQWFGNLVTMKWWTDLWLNEGFASWIEYMAVDSLFPEWQMWTQFLVDEQQPALKSDALEHTHPIVVPVKNPAEIRTIFDIISYSKGASVIQMLHEYLGKDTFRDGLRLYLTTHQYKNTDTADLWEALAKISHKPVKDFMEGWTNQTGYPLLQAAVEEQQISLSQHRFYSNPTRKPKRNDVLWPIPLLTHANNTPAIMEQGSESFSLRDTSNLVFNRGGSGFYRVAYNATHLQRLGEHVRRGLLSPIDRLALLNDAFEAAKAGYEETTLVLDLLKNYENEDNAAVWDVIANNLANLRMIMDDDELRDLMNPYIQGLVTKELKKLGWDIRDQDSHFDRLLRPTLLSMASAAEEPTVIAHALKLFKQMHQSEDIPADLRGTSNQSQLRSVYVNPDVRGVIYGTVARQGGKAEFDKLWALHKAATLSEERNNLTAALTGFTQPELIKRALGLVISEDVRLQDVLYWVAYSFMNRHAKHYAWDWMTDNWQWIAKNLGSDVAFYRFPVYAARAFSDTKSLEKFKKFFTKVMQPELERSVNQGIDMIEWQAAWRKRDLKLIKAYFASLQ